MLSSTEPSQHELSAEDLIVIEALARGHSHQHAGELINRSYKTIARRFDDKVFSDAVEQRKREIAGHLRTRFDGIADEAMDVIQAALRSEDERVRFNAAKFALQKRLDFHQQLDVDERLDEIEEAVRRNDAIDN